MNCAFAFRFDNNRLGRDSVTDQISSAHGALRENGIAAGAARSHDSWREALLVKSQRMVQPRAQHRRGSAAVFGGSQHQNHIGRLRLIPLRLLLDPYSEISNIDE